MTKSAIVIGVRTAPKQLCPVSIGRHGSGIRFQICVYTSSWTPPVATAVKGALAFERILNEHQPS